MKSGKVKVSLKLVCRLITFLGVHKIIELCGKLVFDAVVKEVKDSLYYSIIVDGTPDASHTEQITFVLRYVYCDGNTWEVKERFLKFKDCEKKKGYDIATLTCQVLQESGIDLQNCRGQGYDNGANMSGTIKVHKL